MYLAATYNLSKSSLVYFWPMFRFIPLKSPENKMFSGVFRGYKMGTPSGNGLNQWHGKLLTPLIIRISGA